MQRLTYVAVLAVLSVGACANATTTLFTDRSEFEAMLVPAGHVDFEGIASPGSYAGYRYGGNWTIDQVTFSCSSCLYVVDSQYYPETYDWGSGAMLQGATTGFLGGSALRATLPSPQSMVGMDFFTIVPEGQPVTIRLSTGETFADIPTYNRPNMAFAGFLSDAPISWFELDLGSGSTSQYSQMDNVVYGSAVPEPLTMVGVMIGLAGLGRYARKRLAR